MRSTDTVQFFCKLRIFQMHSRHIDRYQQVFIILLPLLDFNANLIHYVKIEFYYESVSFKQRYELAGRNDISVFYPSYKRLCTCKVYITVKRYLRLIEYAELVHVKSILHFVLDSFFLTHRFKHTLGIESVCAVVAVFYRTLCNIRKVTHTPY